MVETKRLELTVSSYDESLDEAAGILKNGGIVAIPTETVYGLAASAFDEKAISRVFIAKGRPQDNPLIVHISNEEMLGGIVNDVPEKARLAIDRFWPGPFTVILKRSEKIPKIVSAGLDTVAVRMPANKVAADLIEKSGLALAAPSANLSGRPSPTRAEDVFSDLSGRIDAVLMGEDCAVGVESTVVSFTGEHPRLLRPGAVTAEQLLELLPDLEIDEAVLKEPEIDGAVASPGMKYKHYAPKTQVFLVEGGRNEYIDYVNQKQESVALCFSEDSAKINIRKVCYGSENDGEALARLLFSSLRQADAFGAQAIYVHAPQKSGVGLAVYNRLIRAAAFRVISL